MVGEYQSDPGLEPEGQGSHGTHADGGALSPDSPVSALSWLSVSFVMGCLVGAASGYGWLGTLITGWATATAIGIALIIRAALEDDA